MEDELPAEPPVEWDGYDEYPTGEFSNGENEVDDRLAKYKTLESESENEGTIHYVGETLPDDSDDDDDSSDANSMVSYTRGGRCLQCHVKRVDDYDDFDDSESEGEGEGDVGVVDEPTYGHQSADALPPAEELVPIKEEDLDGEPCISSLTSNFNFDF